MIERAELFSRLLESIENHRVTMLSGPRQCGKTTIALEIMERLGAIFFDCEDPATQTAMENPLLLLEPLNGLIIIDEAQFLPSLFPVIRVLVDRDRRDKKERRFLLLGSASPDLAKGVSETLAGRIHFIKMSGFNLREAKKENWQSLWLRGGFPESFLGNTEEISYTWRQDFIQTFLQRDLNLYGVKVPSVEMRRLWTMVAHYHGQLLNASELGRSLGRAYNTIQRNLDILQEAYVLRQLQPWHENIAKRQRKAPKLYIRDSGLLHALLGLRNHSDLRTHPKVGASWEGFALEQCLQIFGEEDAYFWQTQAHAELDLLLLREGKRWGFEFKYADRPKRTRSMNIALEDLKLDRLFVVHPGRSEFPLGESIAAIPLWNLK